MKNRVRAGELRHPISIEEQVETQDSYGGVVITWNNLLDTRAKIVPVTGGEWYINDQLANTVDHSILIRHPRFDIPYSARIIFNGREFNIVKMLNFEERDMHLVILAKEKKQ